MHKIILLIVTVFAVLLAGCNTIKGIGQDVEKGGAAIQKATK